MAYASQLSYNALDMPTICVCLSSCFISSGGSGEGGQIFGIRIQGARRKEERISLE